MPLTYKEKWTWQKCSWLDLGEKDDVFLLDASGEMRFCHSLDRDLEHQLEIDGYWYAPLFSPCPVSAFGEAWAVCGATGYFITLMISDARTLAWTQQIGLARPVRFPWLGSSIQELAGRLVRTSVFPSGHLRMRSAVTVYGNVSCNWSSEAKGGHSLKCRQLDKKAKMQITLGNFRPSRRGPGALEVCSSFLCPRAITVI